MTNVIYIKSRLAEFWWLARERYQMKLRRDAGLPWEAWTEDPLLRHYHFCNVFRWDDRASRAIERWARSSGDPYRAAVLGRIVNKASTIDALAELPCAGPEDLLRLGRELGVNTNAYRLNTPLGLNNIDGMAVMADRALQLRDAVMAEGDIPSALETLGAVGTPLMTFLSGFVGYQVILDLVELGAVRPDFDSSWSFPGPGAARGALMLTGMDPSGDWITRQAEMRRHEAQNADTVQAVMRRLMRESTSPDNWPWQNRPWTIHEVEFMLCEFDKYKRKSGAEKVSGRRYRGPGAR